MVVGESGLGKSTLVNSLFLTDLYPERVTPDAVGNLNSKFVVFRIAMFKVPIFYFYRETEANGEIGCINGGNRGTWS